MTPLKIAIVSSGIAQQEIARKLGMDPTHLSRIVNGLHCDDATKRRIADVLGRDLQELWPEPKAEAA